MLQTCLGHQSTAQPDWEGGISSYARELKKQALPEDDVDYTGSQCVDMGWEYGIEAINQIIATKTIHPGKGET